MAQNAKGVVWFQVKYIHHMVILIVLFYVSYDSTEIFCRVPSCFMAQLLVLKPQASARPVKIIEKKQQRDDWRRCGEKENNLAHWRADRRFCHNS
jgi:hypothetical protein